MAYNLESLITILEQILNPQQTRWIVDHHSKPQLESLSQTALSLKQILEKIPSLTTESLESEIRDAAHRAEDLIETHMVDQMLATPGAVSITFSTPDLQQVIQQLDSLTDRAEKLKDSSSKSAVVRLDEDLSQLNVQLTGIRRQLETIPIVGTRALGKASLDDLRQVKQQLTYAREQVAKLVEEKAASTSSPSGIVVGVDGDMNDLRDRLVWGQRKLEIIPIVGMGGIGKTTLARKLYEDPAIVDHFKLRAWTKISQYYDLRTILLGLLGSIIGKDVDKHIDQKSNHKLKNALRQSLFEKTYLIVLDDIWSDRFWREMKSHFPDSDNGSRIVITTRESNVVKDVSSESKPHGMHALDKSQSWDLLREVVFGEDKCPSPAIERIGKHIARKCGGLRLAINVVGGLLSGANRTEEFWKSVSEDVKTLVAGKGEFSEIFSLSYNCLPSHLRPCFLYMGVFPEDHEIEASRLIRLWVAEGFLKPKGGKSLEEEARDCLQALVDRNLVSVMGFKRNGRPKRYGIHGLMRGLLLKEAEKQRFVQVEMRQAEAGKDDSLRRVSQHDASAKAMRLARSFLYTGVASREILSRVFYGLTLLRVLDIMEIKFLGFPPEILLILNLRYLAFSCNSHEVPSDISRLWNLQTLLIRSSMDLIVLPSVILQMAELRHILFYKAEIKIASGDWGAFVLGKLQSISVIRAPSVCFLKRIPNIRNLRIASDRKHDLRHLHELETLKFSGNLKRALQLRLPTSLRKLSLTRCKISGRFMESLSHLEVLKLQECDLGDEEWDATQLELLELQFLLLESLQLVHWQAEEASFPKLRHLVIRGCSALEEIPSEIGDIMPLKIIELDNHCRDSLVASAQLIVESRCEDGDKDIKLNLL